MATFRFGKDAVLYHSTTALDGASNDAATVTWNEYDNVRDVTGNFTGEKVDTTTRATAKLGWSSEDTVLNKGEISLNIPVKAVADTVFDAIRTAWLNKTLVTLMSLNGPTGTAGNQGLAANFSVSMTKAEPVKGMQTWDVTLTVSSFPEWFVDATP